jgi:hypothetical protein
MFREEPRFHLPSEAPRVVHYSASIVRYAARMEKFDPNEPIVPPLSWKVRVPTALLALCLAVSLGAADAQVYRSGFMHWFLIAMGGITGASLVAAPMLTFENMRIRWYMLERARIIAENSPHNGGPGAEET